MRIPSYGCRVWNNHVGSPARKRADDSKTTPDNGTILELRHREMRSQMKDIKAAVIVSSIELAVLHSAPPSRSSTTCPKSNGHLTFIVNYGSKINHQQTLKATKSNAAATNDNINNATAQRLCRTVLSPRWHYQIISLKSNRFKFVLTS